MISNAVLKEINKIHAHEKDGICQSCFKKGQKTERSRILKEFKRFENADEIKTSQGQHNLWTPADCAVYGVCKEIVKNKQKEVEQK